MWGAPSPIGLHPVFLKHQPQMPVMTDDKPGSTEALRQPGIANQAAASCRTQFLLHKPILTRHHPAKHSTSSQRAAEKLSSVNDYKVTVQR